MAPLSPDAEPKSQVYNRDPLFYSLIPPFQFSKFYFQLYLIAYLQAAYESRMAS